MVTAEEKTNAYGRRYTYYHCSKRRLDYRCRQPSVDAQNLNEAFTTILAKFAIPDRLNQWLLDEIGYAASHRHEEKTVQLRALEKAYDQSVRAQENLITLRVRDTIDDSEFTRQRQALQTEQLALKDRLRLTREGETWFEQARALISFNNRAILSFSDGDHQTKRRILRAVGSNFSLKDRKLSFQAKKPFCHIVENATCSVLWAVIEDVRTLYMARDPEFMETLALVQDLMRDHALSPQGCLPAAV